MIFQVISSLKSTALPAYFFIIKFVLLLSCCILYFVLATVTENENLISWFDIKITLLTKDSTVSLQPVLLSLLTAF